MNRKFLYKLLETDSVTGNEEANQLNALNYMKDVADKQFTDAAGGAFTVINPDAKCRILLSGHMDEIGFRVTNIDDSGMIHVQKAGGVRAKHYIGAPMQIIHDGKKIDAIGVTSKDMLKNQDFEDKDLIIDIGAISKEDALKHVAIGDSVCADTSVHELLNDRVSCRALDDKAGAFVILEAARRAREKGSKNAIYAHTSVGEESNGMGAFYAGAAVNASCAVAVDVTWASDCPGTDPNDTGSIGLGKGPVICLSGMVNKPLNELMKKIAAEKGISLQYEVAGGRTWTDGDVIATTNKGCPLVLVSIPLRYMHSSVEEASWKDLEDCIELISEFVCRIDGSFDYRPVKI
ncbi:MAG: M42 family peptidase [Erysipelotrichaceae bacterium]|nr:M42 family peptidase [Erysipelotrichaceae bacterium]